LNPEILKLIGRLKYRYSYGENVLQHSLEVAHLAGMIAAEVGANVNLAKTGGLLHDIGKALTHEVEGPHAEIGAEVAAKYNVPPNVVACIAEHHDDVMSSTEAFIVAAADAVSAARPGARSDTVENYVKRLEALEEVARAFDGVERCFALQAGREVRVMVKPESVDDVTASQLARDIVSKIEKTLVYPGQIKVMVIRESRSGGIPFRHLPCLEYRVTPPYNRAGPCLPTPLYEPMRANRIEANSGQRFPAGSPGYEIRYDGSLGNCSKSTSTSTPPTRTELLTRPNWWTSAHPEA
jgi:putative nucleotidyltransferase with HDIG domain